MLKPVWFQGLSQPKNDFCKKGKTLVEIFVWRMFVPSVVVNEAKFIFYLVTFKAYGHIMNDLIYLIEIKICWMSSITTWLDLEKSLVKIRVVVVLTLSHGTVSFESDFSINGDFVVKNFKETPLITQHQGYHWQRRSNKCFFYEPSDYICKAITLMCLI